MAELLTVTNPEVISIDNVTYNGDTVIDPVKIIGLANIVLSNSSITVVSATATLSNENAGSRTATVQLILSDPTNYTTEPILDVPVLVEVLSINIQITSVESKEYDGTPDTTLTYIQTSEFISGDDVSINYSAAFTDAYPSLTLKTVNISMSLSGTNAGNYNLIYPTSSTGSITTKELTVNTSTVTISTKTYDGKISDASYTGEPSLEGIIEEDDVSIGVFTLTPDSPSANPAAPLTVTVTLTGNDRAYYTVAPVTGLTQIINTRTLTIAIECLGKEYDGETTVLNPSVTASGLVEGDTLEFINIVANFTSKNAGTTNYTITYDIVDTQDILRNYDQTIFNLPSSGIMERFVQLVPVIPSKPYDGIASVACTYYFSFGNVVQTDDVNITVTAGYADANADTAKEATITLETSGGDVSNYTIGLISTAGFGDITSVPLLVDGITNIEDKEYDGTRTATYRGTPTLGGPNLLPADIGYVEIDQLLFLFDTKDASVNPINVTGTVTLTGTKSQNYYVDELTGFSAFITPLHTTVIITPDPKEYDRTTDVLGYDVSFTKNVDGSNLYADVLYLNFINKDIGTQPVTGALNISGSARPNYMLDGIDFRSADITAKPLTTVGVTVANKEYDRTTDATVTSPGTLLGVISGDIVEATTSASFTTKTVGNGKDVTVTFVLSGDDAGNYTIAPTTSTADITAKLVTVVGYTIRDKQFDETVTATWTGTPTPSGVIGGDTVTVAITSASFDTPDIGTNKPVTVVFELGGADATNYSVNNATKYANITLEPPTPRTPIYLKSLTTDISASRETARIGSINMRRSKAQGTFRPATFQDWIRYLK